MLDTYFELGKQGEHPPKPLGVLIPRFFGQANGLGRRLMFIIFRVDRIDLVDIDGDIGVDPIPSDLQLGSASIEGDHSRPLVFILLEWWRLWESGETGSLSDNSLHNNPNRARSKIPT